MRDFFISYTAVDRAWAEWIGWQLEESGYTVMLQAWGFKPGENFALRMNEALTTTERTIVVLTPDFLASEFAAAEWANAFARDPTGELSILLPVRVRRCEPTGLLRAVVYVDLVGANEEKARAALLAGVAENRGKPPAEPPFPQGSPERAVATAAAYPGGSARGWRGGAGDGCAVHHRNPPPCCGVNVRTPQLNARGHHISAANSGQEATAIIADLLSKIVDMNPNDSRPVNTHRSEHPLNNFLFRNHSAAIVCEVTPDHLLRPTARVPLPTVPIGPRRPWSSSSRIADNIRSRRFAVVLLRSTVCGPSWALGGGRKNAGRPRCLGVTCHASRAPMATA